MPALALVRDAIARAVLGAVDEPVHAGRVTLRPHQREALRLVREAIVEFGGALLADEPGLGKTFVALAFAREHTSTLVLAPAALRGMWREAAERVETRVAFESLETLSRRDVRARADLVIVDEAHHASNPHAARYARLARLAAGARVLLLSATPVRNRRSELDALLALFLGPRAPLLDAAARSRCIIRRTSDTLDIPRVDGPHWHPAPGARATGRNGGPGVARAIASLPPPLPALDGREARALIGITLARAWASSLAALDSALRRRLQRGAALDAVLEAGRVPTRNELRAWVVGEDAVQLAFPLLVERPAADAAGLRRTLQRHLDAVRAIRGEIAPRVERDAVARSALLARIAADHPAQRTVAFCAYQATAEALYRAMRRRPGIALLTARGARTAGGARPRDDILRSLGPRARPGAHGGIDDISLVLATDVLSEGVNLQGASVVVHLDLPWTPAALDQRVGRVARLGSAHERVHVHGIAPPPGAERLLGLERVLARKDEESRLAAGATMAAGRLRGIVARWRASGSLSGVVPAAAAVRSDRRGFLAVVGCGSAVHVVGGAQRRSGSFDATDDPAQLARLAESACGPERTPDRRTIARARTAVARWVRSRRVRAVIASADPMTVARRSVLERLDRMLTGARAHSRPALAGRIRALRARAQTAVGAGAELALRELTRAPSADADAWLAQCEQTVESLGSRGAADGGADHGFLVALLLLAPDEGSSRRPPAVPARRALARSAEAAILSVSPGHGAHEVPDEPQR